MPETSIPEVMDAIAAQIKDALGGGDSPVVEDLQVVGRLTFNPTVPCIDIYPSDPFQEQTAFGASSVRVFFDVRARVTTADNIAGQELLLNMMDPRAAESVVGAILGDRTLSGTVGKIAVDPPSNYGLFVDPGQNEGYLGCTWRTGVEL